MLLGSMAVGQFPRMQRFHGRRIGWLRADVLDWLAKDLRMATDQRGSASFLQQRCTRQMSLPLECTVACTARRIRGACSIRTAVRR
jgi:hypothetical protein